MRSLGRPYDAARFRRSLSVESVNIFESSGPGPYGCSLNSTFGRVGPSLTPPHHGRRACRGPGRRRHDRDDPQRYRSTMTSSPAIPEPSVRPRPGRRRGARWGVIAAASGVVAAGCAWTATALINVPNPVTLAALAVIEPSAIGPWFPSRVVQAPEQARDLPFRPAPILERVPWKGKTVPLATMLAETHTNAFLVVQDGS